MKYRVVGLSLNKRITFLETTNLQQAVASLKERLEDDKSGQYNYTIEEDGR